MINFNEFKRRYQKNDIIHFPNSVPKKVLVSVLVQTYNHEKFITNCLNSILAQKTNFNFEIILGEDCSKDNTRDICIKYAKKHPDKIRLFLHQQENKIIIKDIITGNFNAFYNFFNARGKYIAFCEGDDLWKDENKIQKQVDFLQTNSEYILSYHSYLNHFEKSSSNETKYFQPKANISQTDLLLLKEHPLLLTICFRNKLKQIPREFVEVINLDSFLLSILGEFGKGYFHHEINPALSRKHSGGIWSSKIRINQLEIKLNTIKNLEIYYKNRNKQAFYHFRRIRRFQAKMLIFKASIQFSPKAFIFGLKNFF